MAEAEARAAGRPTRATAREQCARRAVAPMKPKGQAAREECAHRRAVERSVRAPTSSRVEPIAAIRTTKTLAAPRPAAAAVKQTSRGEVRPISIQRPTLRT